MGDGNCSFSRALAELYGESDASHLTCTTYDDKETLETKYDCAAGHIQAVCMLFMCFPHG